jgi:hypothetical protein
VGKDVRHSLFASRYSLPFLIAPAIEAIFKIAKMARKCGQTGSLSLLDENHHFRHNMKRLI